MLRALFGSKDKEFVLQYLLSKNEGYASKIARFFDVTPSQITKQLEALESGDIIVGYQVGRTRLYKFNPRYYFYNELEALLKRARDAYPDELKEKLLFNRSAPRKKNKPYILKGNEIETEL